MASQLTSVKGACGCPDYDDSMLHKDLTRMIRHPSVKDGPLCRIETQYLTILCSHHMKPVPEDADVLCVFI